MHFTSIATIHFRFRRFNFRTSPFDLPSVGEGKMRQSSGGDGMKPETKKWKTGNEIPTLKRFNLKSHLTAAVVCFSVFFIFKNDKKQNTRRETWSDPRKFAYNDRPHWICDRPFVSAHCLCRFSTLAKFSRNEFSDDVGAPARTNSPRIIITFWFCNYFQPDGFLYFVHSVFGYSIESDMLSRR